MSYCRFSSDDWKSDVHVYADVAGVYTIHVAAARIVGDIPITGNLLFTDIAAYMDAHRKQMDFLWTAKREKIGLPNDGDTFRCATIEATVERLLDLRKLGYNVPQFAIDALNEKMQAV